MNFDSDIVLKLKKDVFLSNTAKKQQLIKLLGEKLQLSGCNIIHATGDADLMMVQMAVQSAKSITTVLVGDDAILLVLLCRHFDTSDCDLFYIPQPKVNDAKDLGHQENPDSTGTRNLCKHSFCSRSSRM